MGALNESLATITNEMKARTPLEAMAVLERAITDLQQSGIANGLPLGAKAKDFTLIDATGEKVNLYDQLAEGPVVLTFYRGEWCPYCNRQLRAYEEILDKIKEAGASLIAISPQTPDNSMTTKERNELSYSVLSDTKGLTAAKYNILFDVPHDVKSLYESFGIDLADYNGGGNWMLPVPATFMIDESGIIRYTYVNPNYTERLEPEDLVEALQTL